MATHQGRIVRVSVLLDAALTEDIAQGEALFDQRIEVAEAAAQGRGASQYRAKQSARSSHDARHVRSFDSVVFNRIHLLPSRIDVGNMVSTQIVRVELWNAYLEEARTLSSIEGAIDGVTFTGLASGTIAAFSSIFYDIRVDRNGAAVFDGTLVFLLDVVDARLRITGKRIVVWPFPHGWESPAVAGFEALTDVQGEDSRGTGREQRRRLRNHLRRTIEYSHVIADARAMRRFDALRTGWKGRTYALPIHEDVVHLDEDAEPGATSLAFAAKYRDFDAGKQIAIGELPFDFEIAEIADVADNGVTLVRGLTGNYTAGMARVWPLRQANMAAQIESQEDTATIERITIAWRLLATEYSLNRAVEGARTFYRADDLGNPIDVYLRKNSVKDAGPRVTVYRPIETHDGGKGRFYDFALQRVARVTRDFGVTLVGRQDISDFLAWLDARAGKCNAVWVPTWKYDFELIDPVLSSQTSMRASNFGYKEMYCDAEGVPKENRRDVMIALNDGDVLLRRITGAQIDTDGAEVISFETAFGQDISPDDVDHISFLNYVRLDQDGVQLAFITDEEAHAALRFKDEGFSPA